MLYKATSSHTDLLSPSKPNKQRKSKSEERESWKLEGKRDHNQYYPRPGKQHKKHGKHQQLAAYYVDTHSPVRTLFRSFCCYFHLIPLLGISLFNFVVFSALGGPTMASKQEDEEVFEEESDDDHLYIRSIKGRRKTHKKGYDDDNDDIFEKEPELYDGSDDSSTKEVNKRYGPEANLKTVKSPQPKEYSHNYLVVPIKNTRKEATTAAKHHKRASSELPGTMVATSFCELGLFIINTCFFSLLSENFLLPGSYRELQIQGNKVEALEEDVQSCDDVSCDRSYTYLQQFSLEEGILSFVHSLIILYAKPIPCAA